jgi:uncharacterized protein YndB with AHSA1/START domain
MWRFVMHGRDGTNYPNESVFVEVVAPERVVFEHLSDVVEANEQNLTRLAAEVLKVA